MKLWQFLLVALLVAFSAEGTMPKLKGKKAATAAKGRNGDGKFVSPEDHISLVVREC